MPRIFSTKKLLILSVLIGLLIFESCVKKSEGDENTISGGDTVSNSNTAIFNVDSPQLIDGSFVLDQNVLSVIGNCNPSHINIRYQLNDTSEVAIADSCDENGQWSVSIQAIPVGMHTVRFLADSQAGTTTLEYSLTVNRFNSGYTLGSQSGVDLGRRITKCPNGSYFTASVFEGQNFDVQPGAGETLLAGQPDSSSSLVISKFSDQDIFEKAITIRGGTIEGGRSLTCTGNSDLIVADRILNAEGNVDLDPGPNTVNVARSLPGNGSVLIRYSNDLDYLNHVFIDPASSGMSANFYSLAFDPTNNRILVAAFYRADVSFDPLSTAGDVSPPPSDFDASIVTYSPELLYLSHRSFTSNASQITFNDLTLTQQGDIFLVGAFNGEVNFDPGGSLLRNAGAALLHTFILKLGSDLSTRWVQSFGGAGSGNVNGRMIAINGSQGFVTGYHTVAFDADWGLGTKNIAFTATTYDQFSVAFDLSTGDFNWATGLNSGKEFVSATLATWQAGSQILLCGRFQQSITIGSEVITSNTDNDRAILIFMNTLDGSYAQHILWNYDGQSGSCSSVTVDEVSRTAFLTMDFDATETYYLDPIESKSPQTGTSSSDYGFIKLNL